MRKSFFLPIITILYLSLNISMADEVKLPIFSTDDLPNYKITKTEFFKGKKLYGYINGGAEIFLEYGWGFGVFEADCLVSWAFGWDFLEDFAVVRYVSTLEEFRGKGYGTIVSSAVVSFAFDVMEKPCVFLWVEGSNIPAKKIYDRLGFEVMGKKMSFDGRRILSSPSEKL